MKCVVIGAGPAGLMAAIQLAKEQVEVVLIEKNEKVGKKLYITGKGRCNITNMADRETLLNNVVNNPKFAISSLCKYTPYDTMDFFDQNGVELKVERGNRVFPLSDKSSDIIKCFSNELDKYKVDLKLKTRVLDLIVKDNKAIGVKTTKGDVYCDKVLVATGGISYPLTGSTGDGYLWAQKLGHNIVEPRPGLSAIKSINCAALSGVSLKNVQANAYVNDKLYKSFFGEMLFTGTGLSGPIILSLSSYLNNFYKNKKFVEKIVISIDLKPKVLIEELDKRLIKDLQDKKNQEIKNILQEYTIKALIPYILNQANVANTKQANSITKAERLKIIKALKGLEFIAKDFESIDHAIITAGGVDVKEISPKSMQSKLVENLYFIGEVLDIDALTGGFNIQLALSTAFAAAKSIIDN